MIMEVFVIKGLKKTLAILMTLLMILSLFGCVEKQAYKMDGTTGVDELTIKPGTFEEIKVKLTVSPDDIDEYRSTLASASEGETAPEGNYYLVDYITAGQVEGFEYTVTSIQDENGNPIQNQNTNPGDNILIVVPHKIQNQNYTIYYTLKIQNKQNEEYEANPTADGLVVLFNQEIIFTTEAHVVPESALKQPEAAIKMMEKSRTSKNLAEEGEEELPPYKSIKISTGAPEKISPVLEYVENNKGTFIAHWGYLNNNNFKIILTGDDSRITSGTIVGDAPPTVFEKGRVVDYYKPVITSNNVVWYLKGPDGQGRTSTASIPTMDADLTGKPDKVSIGDIIDYTIKVTNTTQNETYKDVKLVEMLSEGTSFAPGEPNSFSKVPEGNEYASIIEALAPGETKTLHFLCRVNDSFTGESILDALTIEYMVNGSKRVIHLDESTQFIKGNPDLNLTMTRNSGWTLENGKYVFNVGNLAVNETKDVILRVKVKNPFTETPRNVTATIQAAGEIKELILTNNTATCLTSVQMPGLPATGESGGSYGRI